MPRYMKLLYLHAYQSFIWNKTASFLIETRRNTEKDEDFIKIHVGDVVLIKDSSKTKDNISKAYNEDEDEGDDEERLIFEDFQYVTDENISKYSIYDLYIPMIGRKVLLPKNNIGEYIISLLNHDNISVNDNLLGTGAYRKLLQVPDKVKYSLIYHNDKDIELQNEYYNKENHPNSLEKEGKFKSVRLEFQVPQSTYATMVVREVTKQSSSYYNQLELTGKIIEEEEAEVEV